MKNFDYQLDAEETRLLGLLKSQPVSAYSRPSLHMLLRTHEGQPAPELSLQWLHNAGMGSYIFSEMKDGMQKRAAVSLLEKGRLVPTSVETNHNALYQRMTHFDDVNWGLNAGGEVIIFNLSDYDGIPDEVIRPDERHTAALDILAQRRQYNLAAEDTPFALKSGQKVTPILTDPAAISLRARQQKGLIP